MDTNSNQQELYAKYKPLSTWAYVGYILLFCIPVVNLLAILILAFAPENVNVKNFARGYLIHIIFSFIISFVVVGLLMGGYIYSTANSLTNDAVDQIDTLLVTATNAQIESYAGYELRSTTVEQLLTTIENLNNGDTLPEDILVIGGEDLDSYTKYEVSIDYDSDTGYVNLVTITEAD